MKKKDHISAFRSKELLYDYAKGKLSADRAQALEKAIDEHPDLKLDLRNIEERLEILRAFDQAVPSREWIEELSLPHPSLTQQIISLEKRLAPRFWKMLPLSVILASGVFALVLFQPWKMVNFNEVEVAEVHLSDEEKRMEAALALSEKDIEGAMQAQDSSGKKEDKLSLKEPGEEVKVAKNESDPQKAVKESAPPEPKEKPKEKAKRVGELYRGFITVTDLQKVTEGTVQKIVDLGGKKAGQVPLGWKRDEDERYFHFSLPEKNKKPLLEFLSNFSQVRLSNQEHPLVMPEGKIRIILVVKQNPNVEPPSPEEKEEESPTSEQEEPSS